MYVDEQGEDAQAFAHVGVDVFAPFGAPLDSNPDPGEGYIAIHTFDRSYAAFGQADYHLTSKWVLTAGYRYTEQKKSIIQSLVGDPTGEFVPTVPAASFTRTDNDPSYNLSLKYLFADNAMAYATFAHGFKAGGYNAFSFGLVQPNGQPAQFGPEHVDNYEIGTKTTFADGRMRLNADVFYMNYRDLQVNQLIQNSSGIIDFVTSNAAKARSQGVEVRTTGARNRGPAGKPGIRLHRRQVHLVSRRHTGRRRFYGSLAGTVAQELGRRCARLQTACFPAWNSLPDRN